MRRRFLALAAAALVLLAGCSGPNRQASAPTTPAGGRTARSPNPDVIPAVITPAYVDAVFAVLNHINGNAVRSMLAANAVTPTVQRDLRAVFADPLYVQEIKIANQTLAQGTRNFRRPPGDIETTVRRVIAASRSCVFVSAVSNFRAVVTKEGSSAASEYWVLMPKPSGIDPSHLNPTPWALAFNATYASPTSIPNQCAGS